MKMDEKGTTASAGTAAVIAYRGAGPPVLRFHATRPFFFVVRHRATGTILFMAAVNNPDKKPERGSSATGSDKNTKRLRVFEPDQEEDDTDVPAKRRRRRKDDSTDPPAKVPRKLYRL